jgi:hypothetical protein
MKELAMNVFNYLNDELNVDFSHIEHIDEFPNRYGENVSKFIFKYNIKKDSYSVMHFSIKHDSNILFISNHGYSKFSSMDEIKQKIKQTMEETA